jgi:transposase InsO family protein
MVQEPRGGRVVIKTRRRHYNHVRPHQSLNDPTPTPIEFKTRYDSIN